MSPTETEPSDTNTTIPAIPTIAELQSLTLDEAASRLREYDAESLKWAGLTKAHANTALIYAWLGGIILTDVKDNKVKHGSFLDWILENTEISQPTSWRWMRLAEKYSCVNDLIEKQSITDALKDVGVIEQPPQAQQSTSKPAFIIRCVLNVAADTLDEVQRRTMFDQGKSYLDALVSFGFIDIKV